MQYSVDYYKTICRVFKYHVHAKKHTRKNFKIKHSLIQIVGYFQFEQLINIKYTLI